MAEKKKNISLDNLEKFKENLDKDISKHKVLTQVEYDTLTEAEKNNGTFYFIEDGNSAVADSDKDYIDSQDQKTLNSAKDFTTDTVKNYYAKTEVDTLLNTKADMEEATSTKAGMFSATNKVKLDGIEDGAQVNTVTGIKGGAETAYRTGEVNITSENIGLGNVENKSSETIREEITKLNVTNALGYTPPTTNTTYNNATQSTAGLESAADKTKLDGIETGANKYSLPAASSTVRGGVKVGYTANGKNYPVQLSNEQMYVNVPWTDTNTTYGNFVKSGSGAKAGLVPAPSTTSGTTKYLREDGTWQVPPDSNTVYTHPTASGNKHIPSGGSSGQILRWSADGTAVWGADNNTTYSAVTSSANGLATPALLSAANNALPKSGGTMTGALVAQSNNNYTTAQTRNVIISANAPSGTVPDGTIWYQYE